MARPPMIVNGTAYEWSEMERAFHRSVPALFTFLDVKTAFVRGGLSADAVDRAADRFLQAERRRGAIKFSGGRWRKMQVL